MALYGRKTESSKSGYRALHNFSPNSIIEYQSPFTADYTISDEKLKETPAGSGVNQMVTQSGR